jgi:hypothetical protein
VGSAAPAARAVCVRVAGLHALRVDRRRHPGYHGTGGIAHGYGYADVPLRFAEPDAPEQGTSLVPGPGAGAVPIHAQWKVYDPATGGVGMSEMVSWHVRP